MKSGLVPALASLLAGGCAGSQPPAMTPRSYTETAIAVYSSSIGSIRIDLQSLTIDAGSGPRPLADCSTPQLRCFSNEELGFHVALPRSCQGSLPPGGEYVAGGFRFFQIGVVPHGDARQGLYESSLSDRFAYHYFLRIGIHEIRYDPSGRLRFGARSEGRNLYGPEGAPYGFRLPDGQAFLRCQP